jgi:drug/metabolite transporter (DMT)-like permease
VDPLALGLVLVSAVLHATWNILLKTAGDPLRVATAGMVASAAMLVPAAAVAWLLQGRPAVAPEAVALGIVSGVVEVAYFVFLAAAYRRGDLSVVAPVARGTAPLLLVAVGAVVLGERLSPGAAVGVAILLAGLLTVQRPWRYLVGGGSGAHRGAAGFALLTGVTIAVYSSVDRVGVQLAPPWLYAAILWLVAAIGLAIVGWLRPRVAEGRFATDGPLDVPRSVAAGLLTLATYLLVLFAMSRAPVALVGPLRESAVLLTSAYGVLVLHEAVTRREVGLRLAGSVLVVVGAAVIALAG